MDNLAKAYAIMTTSNVEHAFQWHNQRFYYNPVTSKLELIVFDCFSNPGETTHRMPKIHGNSKVGTQELDPSAYSPLQVFNNADFQKKYINYLKTYSSQEYLDKFFASKQLKIDGWI